MIVLNNKQIKPRLGGTEIKEAYLGKIQVYPEITPGVTVRLDRRKHTSIFSNPLTGNTHRVCFGTGKYLYIVEVDTTNTANNSGFSPHLYLYGADEDGIFGLPAAEGAGNSSYTTSTTGYTNVYNYNHAFIKGGDASNVSNNYQNIRIPFRNIGYSVIKQTGAGLDDTVGQSYPNPTRADNLYTYKLKNGRVFCITYDRKFGEFIFDEEGDFSYYVHLKDLKLSGNTQKKYFYEDEENHKLYIDFNTGLIEYDYETDEINEGFAAAPKNPFFVYNGKVYNITKYSNVMYYYPVIKDGNVIHSINETYTFNDDGSVDKVANKYIFYQYSHYMDAWFAIDEETNLYLYRNGNFELLRKRAFTYFSSNRDYYAKSFGTVRDYVCGGEYYYKVKIY